MIGLTYLVDDEVKEFSIETCTVESPEIEPSYEYKIGDIPLVIDFTPGNLSEVCEYTVTITCDPSCSAFSDPLSWDSTGLTLSVETLDLSLLDQTFDLTVELSWNAGPGATRELSFEVLFAFNPEVMCVIDDLTSFDEIEYTQGSPALEVELTNLASSLCDYSVEILDSETGLTPDIELFALTLPSFVQEGDGTLSSVV